jgi:hypothetical protein
VKINLNVCFYKPVVRNPLVLELHVGYSILLDCINFEYGIRNVIKSTLGFQIRSFVEQEYKIIVEQKDEVLLQIMFKRLRKWLSIS